MWNLVTDPTIPLQTKKKLTQKLGTSQRISYRKLVADLRFRHLFIGRAAPSTGIRAAACTSQGISPATDIVCGIPLDRQIGTVILHVSTKKKQTSAYFKRRYIQNFAAGAALLRKTLSFGAGGLPWHPPAYLLRSKGASPSPLPSPQVSPHCCLILPRTDSSRRMWATTRPFGALKGAVVAPQIVLGVQRGTASKQACAQRKSVLDLFIAFYHAV